MSILCTFLIDKHAASNPSVFASGGRKKVLELLVLYTRPPIVANILGQSL